MRTQSCFYFMSQSQHSQVIPPQSQPPVSRVTGDANLPAFKLEPYATQHERRDSWRKCYFPNYLQVTTQKLRLWHILLLTFHKKSTSFRLLRTLPGDSLIFFLLLRNKIICKLQNSPGQVQCKSLKTKLASWPVLVIDLQWWMKLHTWHSVLYSRKLTHFTNLSDWTS